VVYDDDDDDDDDDNDGDGVDNEYTSYSFNS